MTNEITRNFGDLKVTAEFSYFHFRYALYNWRLSNVR